MGKEVVGKLNEPVNEELGNDELGKEELGKVELGNEVVGKELGNELGNELGKEKLGVEMGRETVPGKIVEDDGKPKLRLFTVIVEVAMAGIVLQSMDAKRVSWRDFARRQRSR